MQVQQPIRRALRRKDVIQKTGLSRTTIHNLEKRGNFPAHFLLTPRCAAWFEDEIDSWLNDRRGALSQITTWPNCGQLRIHQPKQEKAKAGRQASRKQALHKEIKGGRHG